MLYSQFKTLAQALDAFSLQLEEARFLPDIAPIELSPMLAEYLADTFPIVSVTGSEKARSEGIVYPILTEVRRVLNKQVSLFSGEEFNVEPETGLTGICDFVLSRSPKQLLIQAPVVMMAEAKKADLSQGVGQCIAEMVAAQRFNRAKQNPIKKVYGCVTSGTQWLFLQLQDTTITIDPIEYSLPPAEKLLGFLVWMVDKG
jgi:hypothetical protein